MFKRLLPYKNAENAANEMGIQKAASKRLKALSEEPKLQGKSIPG